jgi:hypothetical protein
MGLFIGLIIAIIIGILVGQDAAKRGMNGVGWGIFVGSICIIGLPMYLILRKPLVTDSERISQGSMRSSETTKKCPYCAETIKHDAILCRYCGKTLPS